jgi:hypothetical protein
MIVVYFANVSTMYTRVVISSLIGRLKNLPFVILYIFFGIWPKDHHMPLQRLTLVRMSYFALRFPLLDITQYPQTLFTVAKVFPYWISHNTLRLLLHLAAL